MYVAFGGGVNSSAMCLGLYEREERPDAILFADTGGELESTYEHVERFSAWLTAHGMPAVTTVRYDTGPNASLEQECLKNGVLPSLAYGSRSCSAKWKRQPQERWRKAHLPDGTVLIGIDAGEPQRARELPGVRYPLMEWSWDRGECASVIERHGLKVPGKSACWFCPASKKHEVLDLAAEQPHLLERAISMERNASAKNRVVAGLGRHWSWETLVKADRVQLKLFPEAPELPCMCDD